MTRLTQSRLLFGADVLHVCLASACRQVGDVPLLLERQPGGAWKETGAAARQLRIEVSRSDAAVRSEEISSVTGSAPRQVSCRKILILSEGSGSFVKRVGYFLAYEMKRSLGMIETIEYYPPGSNPPEGGLAPDMVLSLNAAFSRAFWVPFYRSCRAAVSMNPDLGPVGRDADPNPIDSDLPNLAVAWGASLSAPVHKSG